MNELVELVEQWSKDKGLDGTIFKIITDYENYVVSNTGDVIRLEYRDKKGANRPFKLLKPNINEDGYASTTLRNDGGKKAFRIHRLVAREFIPNPENKETVNHIDGNKLNNRVENLEWNTREENMQHAYKTGLKKSNNIMTTSSKMKMCKPVKITVKETGDILYFLSARECSRHFGYSDRWCDKSISEMNGNTRLYTFEYVTLDDVKNNTDKVSFKTLVELVEYWSFEKELHKGNSFVQLAKFFEESGEVASALCKDNRELLKDSVGDVIVTLIILAQQNDMKLEDCLKFAWEEIKNRKGKMSKDGSFIKEADLKETPEDKLQSKNKEER